MRFPRAAGLPTRDVVAQVVVEGAFGVVQDMKGTPELVERSVDPQQVVRCDYDIAQAKELAVRHLQKKGSKKYKAIPEVDIVEFSLVYKQHYACLCQRGNKRFQRVIDAELVERNYMLDIRLKELSFEGCAEQFVQIG